MFKQSDIALISCASKVMLNILHARLQHYTNQELPNFQAGFRKGRGTGDQIGNIRWVIEKEKEFQKKTATSVSLTMLQPLTVGIIANCGKSLRDGNTRPSYFCPEKPVFGSRSRRILYGTTDWFRIEKGVWQGCLLSPYLLNLYTEHIMRNAGPDELQAEIKIGRRNINKLRYVDDTIIMAESKEELKNLLARTKKPT